MELHDAEESMGIRKILAHDNRMKKNPQTKEDIFWGFQDFRGVIRVPTPTWIPARKLYQWRRSPRNRLYAGTFSDTLY